MSVHAACPCGMSLQLPSGHDGRRAICPQCRRPILPSAAAGPRPIVPIIPLTAAPQRKPATDSRSESVLWILGTLLLAGVLTGVVAYVVYPHAEQPVPLETVLALPQTAPTSASGVPPVRAVTATLAKDPSVPVSLLEPYLSARPRVEVVFCLDTTASMGHLLQGAKQKIWAISNRILTGRPTPDLRVGIVAYRDRGAAEEYVTRVFDLSSDLDAVGGQLRSLSVGGGGDLPESVNQALDEGLNKLQWSRGSDALRILFLVGDAEPHMDYPDDVKYPVTCRRAVERGVIVNTIQCGVHPECQKHWKEIARLGGGRYVQITQSGGVVVTATPFDERLVAINRELAESVLVYGDANAMADGQSKRDAAMQLTAAFGAADRAAYSARNRRVAAYDLLDDLRDRKVKLTDLPAMHLPPVLRELRDPERIAYLEKVQLKREELWKEALDLDRRRTAHVLGSENNKAFDSQVLEILREQAARYHIGY